MRSDIYNVELPRGPIKECFYRGDFGGNFFSGRTKRQNKPRGDAETRFGIRSTEDASSAWGGNVGSGVSREGSRNRSSSRLRQRLSG